MSALIVATYCAAALFAVGGCGAFLAPTIGSRDAFNRVGTVGFYATLVLGIALIILAIFR